MRTDRYKEKYKSVTVDFEGYTPPASLIVEKSVLGTILMVSGAMDVVTEFLKSEDYFYSAEHRYIFSAMLSLHTRGIIVDMPMVADQLMRDDKLEVVGGAYYLMELQEYIFTDGRTDLTAQAKVLAEKYMLREMIKMSVITRQEAFKPDIDVFELLDNTESYIFDISMKNTKTNYEKVDKGLVEIVNRINSLRSQEVTLTGIPTGFHDLDTLTCGWQEPDLIILAARPSVGKTCLALNLLRNAAVRGVPVGLFSLEMSARQCRERLLSAESGISIEKIIRGKLSDKDMENLMTKGVEPVSKMPIFIDDTSGLSIYQLRSKVRSMVRRHGVKMIVVDYIQLMSGVQNGRTDNREQEIGKISRDLKNIAKELSIPVIALSQLSREVEKRKAGDQIPKLADLRDSGSIEQDADMVIFIYRPEYYGITSNEHGESIKGETHLRVAKHRNGALDTIKLTAELWCQKFVEPTVTNVISFNSTVSESAPFGTTDDPPF